MKVLFASFLICLMGLIYAQSPKVNLFQTQLQQAKEDTTKVGVLLRLSQALLLSGKTQKAIETANAGLLLTQKLNYPKGTFDCLKMLGNASEAKGKYDEAKVYFEKAKEKAQNKEDIALALGNIGNVYKSKGVYDTAIIYHQKAMALVDTNLNTPLTRGLKTFLGLTYLQRGKFQEGIALYLRIIPLCISAKDSMGLLQSYLNLGTGYASAAIRQFDKAIESAEKAHIIAVALHYKTAEAAAISNLGSYWYQKRDLAKTRAYWEESEKILKETDDIPKQMAIKANLAAIYAYNEQYQKGIDLTLESLAMSREIGEKRAEANCLIHFGYFYWDIEDYENCDKYYWEGIELAKKIKAPDLEMAGYREYASVLAQRGDLIRATEFNAMFADSLTTYAKRIEQAKTITEKLAKEAAQYDAQKNKLLMYGFGGAFLLALGFVLLFFRLAENRKRLNEGLEKEKALQNEINRLLEKDKQEIKHSVMNNISMIGSVMRIRQRRTNDASEKKLLAYLKNQMDILYDLYETFYQTQDTTVAMQDYLPKITELLERFHTDEQKPIQFHIETDKLALHPDLASGVARMIAELVTNSVKHAFTDTQQNKNINISLRTHPHNQLQLSVIDNGENSKESVLKAKESSFGLSFIELSVQWLNGTMKIEQNKGTRFIITFPNT